MPVKQKEEKKGKTTYNPSKYNPKYANIIYNMCLLGATDKDIAAALEIAVSTLHDWKHAYPSVLDAIKRGKEQADGRVVRSLFEKATGYQHKAIKMQLDRHGKWQTKEYMEKFAPDTIACIFWLKNRQPDKWREKMEIDNNKTIIVKIEGEEE